MKNFNNNKMENKKSYNYNDVYKQTLEYFKGDELATNVWISKYCLKEVPNETKPGEHVGLDKILYYELSPKDMFNRLTSELYRTGLKYNNPLTYDEIYELLNDFKYVVPQGRPMAGIGNDNDITSISNCFVVSYPNQDSYGTICRVDQEIAQISKRGGGVGTDLSSYRPSNSKVKNAAMTTTGPVEICANRYSATIREVGQCGRRGALMLSMDIDHKDAENFIDAKMEDGKITGANISVKIKNDWLNSFIDNENPNKENERLWNKIIHNAWAKAEPGVLFWDTIINESVPDCYSDFGFKTLSTNPCFPGSEYLLTEKGYVKFNDLYKKGEENIVLTDNRVSYIPETENERPDNWKIDNSKTGTSFRNASHVFLTKKNAEILELKFSNGIRLKCTPDHHIATSDRGMIEAKDLTLDDKILISIPEMNESIVGKLPTSKDEIISFIIGLITGDGTFSKSKKSVMIDFWGEDKERMLNITLKLIDELYLMVGELKNSKNVNLSKYYISKSEKNNKVRIQSSWLFKVLKDQYSFSYENKFEIPEFIINNSRTSIGKFYLAGFYYCDGSIQKTRLNEYSVRLSQSNENLLRQVQLVLGSNGILSSCYKRRDEHKKLLSDGKGGKKLYNCKAQFELISNGDNVIAFIEKIGFFGDLKKENKFTGRGRNHKINQYTRLVSITKCENEDVYCIKEPITRSIIVNGCTTRRCGEIPLSNKDSCRLMLLNLYSYVKNPFSDEAVFDYKLLRDHSRKIMKIMDNMIDLEIEKIDKIIEKIESDPEDESTKKIELDLWKEIKRIGESGRRSGIGVTAEGDMLAALGFKYGTPQATEFAASIHKLISTNVYIGSCDLVQKDERLKFECFNWELEKNNPFINRLISSNDEDSLELREKIVKGRRNIACLTIPPAGSTSIMTQTTSGVEPLFMPYYSRKRKIDKNPNIKPDFIDGTGDWFQTYFVIHHKFVVWYANTRNLSIEESNNILSTMKIDELNSLFEKSPYFGATSRDVDWVEKVKMQGAIQKWIDHSISATTNIPSDTSEDIVKQIYETSWRCGCKGMTIYRDGCRDGVLNVANENKNNEPTKHNESTKDNVDFPEKRPKSIQGKVVRFNNSGEKWVSVVGIINNKPYEIFTGLLDKLNIPQYVEDGFIIKNKEIKLVIDDNGNEIEKLTSRYDFQYKNKNGEIVTSIGLSEIFNEEYWNYAKLISATLRNNMPIEYVVKMISSLNLRTQSINSWKNGVTRTLKKFIKDGTSVGEKCPECGGNLIRISGCVSCQDCAWSKCN